MALEEKVKNIINRLDKLSPYPRLYPFIMSDDEKKAFDEVIRKSGHYLEFGLGGSSLRAIRKSKAKIYTVESSPEWIDQMRKYLVLSYAERKRLVIHSVNIGPTGEWGYPKSGNDERLFEGYSSSVFDRIDSKSIDLALVDGRFRVACTMKIIMSCHGNKNLKILIHDFWNRKQYHTVLKYLDVVKRVDTLGIFTIKDNVDIESVQNEFERYKLNPQ